MVSHEFIRNLHGIRGTRICRIIALLHIPLITINEAACAKRSPGWKEVLKELVAKGQTCKGCEAVAAEAGQRLQRHPWLPQRLIPCRHIGTDDAEGLRII